MAISNEFQKQLSQIHSSVWDDTAHRVARGRVHYMKDFEVVKKEVVKAYDVIEVSRHCR